MASGGLRWLWVSGMAAVLGISSASAEPRATIVAPAAGACVCAGSLVSVTGMSFDTVNGEYVGDRLEYATNPGTGPWTLIGSSSTPIGVQSLLYAWSTAGLAPGQYVLRLTTAGASGSTTAISSVNIVSTSNAAAPLMTISDSGQPGSTSFVDEVCLSATNVSACAGALTPVIEIRRVGDVQWQSVASVDRGTYVEARVRMDQFSPALASGEYDLRASVQVGCAGTAESVRRVTLWRGGEGAGPPRVVEIDGQSCGTFIRGVRGIAGSVSVADLVSWTLMYQSSTMAAPEVIGSGDTPVTGGLLGVWDTRLLPPCAYTLRLSVQAAQLAGCGGSLSTYESVKSVHVGCPGDFNRSGQVSVQDVFDFLTEFFSACP